MQKTPRFESLRLQRSAGHEDAHCMLNIAGVCNYEGNVLCHIRLPGLCGGSMKPDDLMASFGCTACHDVFDQRRQVPGLERGSKDWLFYALRGMARTHQWWRVHGYLAVR